MKISPLNKEEDKNIEYTTYIDSVWQIGYTSLETLTKNGKFYTHTHTYILRRCIKILKKVKQISFTYVLLLSLYYISYYNEKGKIKIMKSKCLYYNREEFS